MLHGSKFRCAVERIDLGAFIQDISASKVRNALRGGW
jgi:hypothetical protein